MSAQLIPLEGVAQVESPRRFKWSIRAKIFGLAIILLVLTIALAIFLLLQVVQTEDDLDVIANLDIPLANSIEDINDLGLRRRLAFEREFGVLNSQQPDPQILSEAAANYALFTPQLGAELAHARALIAAYPQKLADRPAMIEIRLLLDQLEQNFPTITDHQEKVLAFLQAHRNGGVPQEIDLLNDLQRNVQTQRETLQDKMDAFIAASVQSSHKRQRQVLWLSLAATISTVLLGLSVAALIIDRITRPVQSLMVAMKHVQQGNLEIRLPVNSGDEVGDLTQSFNYFVEELQSKERIKSTFGKYIDPRIIEQVLLQPGMTEVAGGRCIMTVLFADLVGFTNVSERLTPSLMVTLLNRHFGLQAKAVQEHQGIVDKFIGDCVMAFWGPPFVQTKDTAQLACQSAQGQIKALTLLRSEIPELTGLRRDAPDIDIRIGMCTGEVVVGNIGSENTRSYTVIGDTVNLASRLEAVNRVYGTRIMIDETTAQSLGSQFATREIDLLSVKGKTEPTRVFELLESAEFSAEDGRFYDDYSQALAAYRKQEWDRAEGLFKECLQRRPTDGPSLLFLKRIAILRETPPAPNWDGVWRLEAK